MAAEQAMATAVETKTCLIWKDEVLRIKVIEGAEIDLDDAKENVRVATRMAAGRREPMLVDLRRLRSQTAEARAYFAGPDCTKVCRATALLVDSPLSRAIGNFYLGFNRPAVPTRIFTDEVAALRWLLALESAAT